MPMAIFIDTGVFVAVRNKSDVNYGRARELKTTSYFPRHT